MPFLMPTSTNTHLSQKGEGVTPFCVGSPTPVLQNQQMAPAVTVVADESKYQN